VLGIASTMISTSEKTFAIRFLAAIKRDQVKHENMEDREKTNAGERVRWRLLFGLGKGRRIFA
jgi:hypothetical protein